MGETILLLEDEDDILSANERMLKRRGYNVLSAKSVKEAKDLLMSNNPDLLILDVMLPDGSGAEICRIYRERSDKPIVFLSAKNTVSDKVEGLSIGADYYITKPFYIDEILAVIERLLSREKNKVSLGENEIQRGDLVLDIIGSRALISGVDAGLTLKEFKLLLALVQNEGTELSCDALYEKVWNVSTNKDTRVVRTHIYKLRNKILADSEGGYDITSHYGRGYTFEVF